MALLARDALVSIAHRRAAALNYRLQGHNYAAMPSKFYAIAAAGRPIIAICSKDGEIARRIRQHRCGEVVAPGDIEALVKAILRFAAESALVAAMGRKARDMLAAGSSRRQALQKWHNALQSIGQTR
jgi:glycosyltransferase involved in cell wall biosynthesis